MADFAVIQDVSLELRRQVFRALQQTPDTDFGLAGSIDRITLAAPGDQLPSETVASLYLYQVEIDPHRRNQPPLPDRDDAAVFREPPLPLKLHYLFVPLQSSEETNQLVLGRTMQHLHAVQDVDTLAGTPVGDSHGGADPVLRIVPDALTLEQSTQLWNAFSVPYRVGTTFRVEVVAIDSSRAPRRRVRTAQVLTAIGQGR